MEEIDIGELFEWFWSKKLLILFIAVIAAGIGFFYTYNLTTPLYSSSTTLVLVNSSENTSESENSNSTITTTDITLNSSLVSTYSELIKSNKVIRQVVSNLKINIDEEELKDNITVEAVEDAEIIKITVANESPTYAAEIANEIADVFSDIVDEIYNINNVHVVDEAEVATEPSNINHIKDIVIFAFIGLVIAIAYVLIINFLDTTIKGSAEVEREFGISVIASIPLIDNDKGEM